MQAKRSRLKLGVHIRVLCMERSTIQISTLGGYGEGAREFTRGKIGGHDT